MDPGGHQIVPGALGGGLGQHGGLDLQKALLVEVVPGNLHHTVAGGDHVLHHRAAQVQIPVLQSQHLVGLAVVQDLKGRGVRLGQQPQLLDLYLNLAGGDLQVLAGPLPDHAHGGHHVLAAQALGLLEDLTVGGVVKGQLQNARAVPQVHKDQRADVPLPLDPAAHGHGLADVRWTKGAAVVRAGKTLHRIHHSTLLFVYCIVYFPICNQTTGNSRASHRAQQATSFQLPQAWEKETEAVSAHWES